MSERTGAPGGAPSDQQRALGRAIRAARWPMTQPDVGSLLGTPQSVVSTWETGRVAPSIDRLAELDELFGRPRGALLLESEAVSPEAIVRHTRPKRWRGEVFDLGDGPMRDFPALLLHWLEVHDVLIDSLRLAESLKDSNLTTTLRASGPIVRLRSSIEILFGLRGEMEATQTLGRILGDQNWPELWATISDAPCPGAA